MMMHGISVLLVTSAVGYWVLTHSQKEKGNIKRLGQWLGLAIIALSVAGAACRIYCAVSGSSCSMMGGMGKGGACPFTGKPAEPAQ